ncbi:xylulokinase [Paenibacillus daejeonensis]|uniref:xylulokinase n=1 Tax=Paenibacillus daejeonensis TaxID=135193 RepID=UPI00035CB720|nr:FGGY family carbohydrate kinase [Paenibacillus daejeonensis]
MSYLIGLDIGTSAVKGVLLRADGTIAARAQRQVQVQTSVDGRVQLDADDLYARVTSAIHELAAALPDRAMLAALSIASASGNTVLLDEGGKPLHPAFSWMDARARSEIAEVFGKLDAAEVHERIGWPLLDSFPLAHLSWLRCHEPELLDRAARVGMTTDYILYRLTGEWGIDSSTATTFYLQDQQAGSWYAPYLAKLGIAEEKLPRLHQPGTVLGRISAQAAGQTGLSVRTPVVLGAFDHPSAARGAGVLGEGQLLLSCGTSWVGFYPLQDRSQAIGNGLLTDPFLQPDGAWGGLFSLPAIATSVDRCVSRYLSAGPDRNETFSRLAATAQPGAGGLLLHPERAADADLSAYAPADVARALMEGTAYLLRMKIDGLAAAGLAARSVTMVGGPSETFPWPQIVADVLGIELATTNGSCAGAVGSAILAGIGVGLYADEREALRTMAFPALVRTPDPAVSRFYDEQYQRFVNQYSNLGGA